MPDKVMINGARVVKADIGTSNGSIHVYEAGMLPESLDPETRSPPCRARERIAFAPRSIFVKVCIRSAQEFEQPSASTLP